MVEQLHRLVEGLIDMTFKTKDQPIIRSLSPQEKGELATLLGTTTEDDNFVAFEKILIQTAFIQEKLNSLVLPNKTELDETFTPIKNHLNKARKQLNYITGEGRALLDQHYAKVTENRCHNFEKEINNLNEAMSRYLAAVSKNDNSVPQGKYADSIVPIAQATQRYFPNVSIKTHRNSKFHQIISFYFKEFLNKPKANYEYDLKQALKT